MIIEVSPISYTLKECDHLSNVMRSASISLKGSRGTTTAMRCKSTCSSMVMIRSAGGGITLHIKKKAETAGELKAYIYLVMDAQLNNQNGAFISAMH